MRSLIRQSFDIFNVYGKDPEAAKNILHGFSMVLEDHTDNDISFAFKEWLKEKSTMPTPSDICSICNARAKERKEEENHKKYYSALMIGASEYTIPKKEGKAPAVSWAGKMWESFTNADKENLMKHMGELMNLKGAEVAKTYWGYLMHFSKVPSWKAFSGQ